METSTQKPLMDGTEPEEALTIEQKVFRLEQIVCWQHAQIESQAAQIQVRGELLERIGRLLDLYSSAIKRHEEILTKAFPASQPSGNLVN